MSCGYKRLFPGAALLFFWLLVLYPAHAQHGQAEPGYYPVAYIGDTWEGNVTAVDDQSKTITLTYVKGSKSQTFVIKLADGLAVHYTDGTSKDLKPSDLAVGTSAIAYYNNFSEKIDGKKTDVHEAFEIRTKDSEGKEHTYKAPFDPKLKSWGQGGVQVSGGGLDH